MFLLVVILDLDVVFNILGWVEINLDDSKNKFFVVEIVDFLLILSLLVLINVVLFDIFNFLVWLFIFLGKLVLFKWFFSVFVVLFVDIVSIVLYKFLMDYVFFCVIV